MSVEFDALAVNDNVKFYYNAETAGENAEGNVTGIISEKNDNNITVNGKSYMKSAISNIEKITPPPADSEISASYGGRRRRYRKTQCGGRRRGRKTRRGRQTRVRKTQRRGSRRY